MTPNILIDTVRRHDLGHMTSAVGRQQGRWLGCARRRDAQPL